MKEHVLVLTFFLTTGNVLAQFSGSSTTHTITGPQNVFKSEIPMAQPSVKGSTYLEENWQHADIVLKDGYVIKDLPIRIEIEQPNVEVKYNGEIKYLDLKKVDFINYGGNEDNTRLLIKQAEGFTYNEEPLKGLVAIHKGQRYIAVKHFYIEFLQANYNVAMDVGSKDHRKVKREKLYIAQGDQLVLVKSNEKKIASKLGGDKDKAISIIREHHLNLTQEKDLYKFVDLL